MQPQRQQKRTEEIFDQMFIVLFENEKSAACIENYVLWNKRKNTCISMIKPNLVDRRLKIRYIKVCKQAEHINRLTID